jgi:hypothetical protein
MTGNFGEEIVHIIPLGFEIDRAVKVFEEWKANRAYLLTLLEQGSYAREHHQKQLYYLVEVQKRLQEKGIEVIPIQVDTFDLLDVVRRISRLIREEKAKSNLVYVNISASGRLTSVGSALAAMAHDAKVYYVVADRYSKNEIEEREHGLSICEKLEIKPLKNFIVQLPDEKGLKILVELAKSKKGLSTKDILTILKEMGVPGFEKEYSSLDRGEKTNYLMKLNKGILEKLRSSGYITTDQLGKFKLIRITESGKYVAYISGLL